MKIGWFQSLMGVVVGAAFGLALSVGALGLLYWAEGRLNLAELARESRVAPPDARDPALEGAFVSATGALATSEALSDNELLRAEVRVQLTRGAEMFAWVEQRRSRNGRDEYDYTRAWTSHPADSAHFRHPAGHYNPPMRVRPGRWTAAEAHVARYAFHPREATLPAGPTLALSADMLVEHPPYAPTIQGNYLYIGARSVETPDVGDQRISYRALRPGATATLFGDLHGALVVAHAHGHGTFYRLLPGTRADAIAALALEHRVLTWLLRLAGFLLLYVGLNLAAAPLSAMFDIIPALGRASRALVAAALLPVAFGLALATVVVSRIAHNPVATAVVLVALVALAVVAAHRRRSR